MPLRALLFPALVCMAAAAAQVPYRWEDGCSVFFGGRYGQVEVGGPFAAAEFHGSRPLPSRISFYAPVANSIDVSTDYWRRGESRPLVAGVRVDERPKQWLGKEPWEYTVSPHTVRFVRVEGDLEYTLLYEFCLHEPAAVITLRIHNGGTVRHAVEVYTHLLLSLRSCQTYARFDSALMRYETAHHAIVAGFAEAQLGRAAVVVQNVGVPPVSHAMVSWDLAIADSGWSNWVVSEVDPPRPGRNQGERTPAAAAFRYQLVLSPGDSSDIVQVVSSSDPAGRENTTRRLAQRWKEETVSYANEVRLAALTKPAVRTGDPWIDSSAAYARALLAANRHFLDGTIVPMPCPAEYNFFFTHDVLLTDLSTVFFDAGRVKQDLWYVASHSADNIIPHAYYWRDDGYKTEYCAPGNWNHLWFILAGAAYLRHTMDTAAVAGLYSLMTRSLEETLQKRSGDVMRGIEPDWWDFGHAEGLRAYLTILTSRALEEYVFVSARLGKNLPRLAAYEDAAEDLRRGLLRELWDEEAGYLLNYTGSSRDNHIYMGPLLAAVYGLLPTGHARRLVATATATLLDSMVGIRTVSPADFHTPEVKAFYRVSGNEAGDPYLYANGGVWYLGNAWYAAALASVGEIDRAFSFFRRTMTVDGILQSPYGQPALYEYRFADPDAPEHGRPDKPTMMWSAGFCLGTAYRLAGMQENVWNISAGEPVPSDLDRVSCRIVFGAEKDVERSGHGRSLTDTRIDGQIVPSRVLPLDARAATNVSLVHGPVHYPYLDRVNAVLHAASLDVGRRRLLLALSSFEGHRTDLVLVTPWEARDITLNGRSRTGVESEERRDGTLLLKLRYSASAGVDTVAIQF